MAEEYIEKWSAVNKLTDIENKCQKFKPFNEAEQEMYRLICETEINIGKTPAADVVEVVRCKDCKHCAVASWGERYCARSKGVELNELRDDDFCSYGERRDNNAAD